MTEIKTRKKNDLYIISVIGEIDAGSSIHLDNAINAAVNQKEKKILVDLSKLEYISSAGLGVFISHLDEFKNENIALVIFGTNQTVFEVFQILGLEKLLTIVQSESDAISAIS